MNVPIAGLAGLPVPDSIHVDVTLGHIPAEIVRVADADTERHYVSSYQDELGQPGLSVFRLLGGKFYRFSYSDGTIAIVDSQGENVWAVGPDQATVEDTATYLLGPILGFVLRLRGITCLHASAVAIGGKAIALVGPSGAGKSTTAAAFAQKGYPILSDDVVALSDFGDRFEVRPAYPRVRLWPESAASLFGSADRLPRITPNWGKRFLDLNDPDYRFQAEPLQLAAVYVLGQRDTASTFPSVERVSPSEGLITLAADTYGSTMLNPAQRADEFDVLARLVESIPIRRVTPPAGLSRIGDLCDAIVEDLDSLDPRRNEHG